MDKSNGFLKIVNDSKKKIVFGVMYRNKFVPRFLVNPKSFIIFEDFNLSMLELFYCCLDENKFPFHYSWLRKIVGGKFHIYS